ncbi:hypothetical protein MRS44_009988 [Fusarium solani]|uniref:uncharacterized protein n=1 Tax=Fusarium solani TaxID=169388 RepID=UPI0032C4305D|nr:hypothetical protein MRS44_009988 [Fusarium solani]
MHFSTASVLATLISAAAAAKQMQINYYTDTKCKSYVGQVDVAWASSLRSGKTNCFNFHYGTAMNIVECQSPGCFCNLFKGKNCENYMDQMWYGDQSSCRPWADQVQSFACYYNA